jgi:hypothetical protein
MIDVIHLTTARINGPSRLELRRLTIAARRP